MVAKWLREIRIRTKRSYFKNKVLEQSWGYEVYEKSVQKVSSTRFIYQPNIRFLLNLPCRGNRREKNDRCRVSCFIRNENSTLYWAWVSRIIRLTAFRAPRGARYDSKNDESSNLISFVWIFNSDGRVVGGR